MAKFKYEDVKSIISNLLTDEDLKIVNDAIEDSRKTEISISVTPSKASLTEGETLTLVATTKPASATVTWTSSKTATATVADGVVTAVKAGKTTITGTIESSTGEVVSDTCAVTVVAAPTVTEG